MQHQQRVTSIWIRYVFTFMALALASSFAAPAEAASKYAGFVVDTNTGRVLYEENADALRYPASLTKMMTLYMTFEALEKGKLKLNQSLPVSAKAARMPQTNIALKPGDKVTVDTLIRSLVVRSANDSSVVLAEALGKTEWNFAMLMTQKARKLGMKNTIFRNANGLPNSKQLSTARDLAMLGLALKRDFPQYYPYFKLQSFSYNGRFYPGHNRVLGRLDGADGIKTGYTNASGFNLVTSARQYGHNVIGVVLGGSSGRSRDDQMVSIMSRAFRQIASGDTQGRINRQFAMRDIGAAKTTQVAMSREETAPTAQGDAGDEDMSNLDETTSTSDGHAAVGPSWGIQIGAYGQSREALFAATNAMRLASRELAGSKIAVSDDQDGKVGIHRARLADLTEQQAKNACRKLILQKESCFVYRADL